MSHAKAFPASGLHRDRDLHHSIGSRRRSPTIALSAPKRKSRQMACTETGLAPFDRESPQESENRTLSPQNENRARWHAQRRDRFMYPSTLVPAPWCRGPRLYMLTDPSHYNAAPSNRRNLGFRKERKLGMCPKANTITRCPGNRKIEILRRREKTSVHPTACMCFSPDAATSDAYKTL